MMDVWIWLVLALLLVVVCLLEDAAMADRCFDVTTDYGRRQFAIRPVKYTKQGQAIKNEADWYKGKASYEPYSSDTGHEAVNYEVIGVLEWSEKPLLLTYTYNGLAMIHDAPCRVTNGVGEFCASSTTGSVTGCGQSCDTDGATLRGDVTIRMKDGSSTVWPSLLSSMAVLNGVEGTSGDVDNCCSNSQTCGVFSGTASNGAFTAVRSDSTPNVNQGFVIGPITTGTGDWCATIELSRLSGADLSTSWPQRPGITHFRFLTGASSGTATNYIDIPRADVGNSIQICVNNNDNYCAAIDDCTQYSSSACGDCIANPRCTWCNGQCQAITSPQGSVCAANGTTACCPICASYTSCGTCTADTTNRCGWCQETQTCMSAVSGKPCTSTGAKCSSIQLNNGQCTTAIAPVHRAGQLATWSTPTFLRTDLNNSASPYFDLQQPSPWTATVATGFTGTAPSWSLTQTPVYARQDALIGIGYGTAAARGAYLYYNQSQVLFPRWSHQLIQSSFVGLGNYMGVVFRLTDVNNYYSFEWATLKPNVCLKGAQLANRVRRIKRNVGGVATELFVDRVGYDTAPPLSRIAIYVYEWAVFDTNINQGPTIGDVTQIIVYINGQHWATITDNAATRPRYGSSGLMTIGETEGVFDYLYVTPLIRAWSFPSLNAVTSPGVMYATGETYFTVNVTSPAVTSGSATGVLQAVLQIYDAITGALTSTSGQYNLAIAGYTSSSQSYAQPPSWRSDGSWDTNVITNGNGVISSATASPSRYDVTVSLGGPIISGQWIIAVHAGVINSGGWKLSTAQLPVTPLQVGVPLSTSTVLGAAHFSAQIPAGVSRVICTVVQSAPAVVSTLRLYANPGVTAPFLVPRPGVQGIGKDYVYMDANATGEVTRILSITPDSNVVAFRFSVYAETYSDSDLLVQPFIITLRFPTPVITAISPVLPKLTSGGSAVTIIGRDFFGATTDVGVASSAWPTVRIGGVICPLVVSADTPQTQTQLVCTLGVGVGKDLYVLITTPLGLTNTINPGFAPLFSYDAPSLQPPTPSIGPTSGGILITLQGTNFGVAVEQVTVLIGGGVCTIASLVSHSTIQCTLPAGRGASATVSISVSGQIAYATNFAYQPPQISSFTPASGNSVGTILSLSGNNFGGVGDYVSNPDFTQCNSTSGTWIRVGSMACVPITARSNHTNVYCQLPTYVGTQQVTICVSGQSAPASQQFIYSPPEILTLTPSHGSTQGGTIALTCRNLGPAGVYVTAVASHVDGTTIPLSIVAHPDDASLVVTIPPDYSNSYTISVSVGPSSTALSTSQTVATYTVDAPHVYQLIPSIAPAVGNINLTIIGDNFAPSFESRVTVTVNGQPCPPSWMNHTYLVCLLPAGVGASKTVLVTRSFSPGTPTVSPIGALFSYAAPRVDLITPTKASIAQVLTITGQHFGTSASLASVWLGTYACNIITLTDAMITCSAATGQGASLMVLVIVDGQNNTASTYPTFDFNVPVILSISPQSAHTDGTDITDPSRAAILSCYGTDFGVSPAVYIGSNACTGLVQVLDEQSNTIHLECTIPAGEGALLDVRVVSGGQWSPSLNWVQRFSYPPPEIDSISPTNGASVGNFPLTLTGSDFGVSRPASTNHSLTITPSCVVADDSDSLTTFAGSYWLLSPDASYHLNFMNADSNPSASFNPTLPLIGNYRITVRVRSSVSIIVAGGTTTDTYSLLPDATVPGTGTDSSGLWRDYYIGEWNFADVGNARITIAPNSGVTTSMYVDRVTFCAATTVTTGTFTDSGLDTLTSNAISFKAPAATGRNQIMSVTIGGQASTYDPDMILFSYDAPTITRVESAVCTSNGTAVINCPLYTGAYREITIIGTNFGTIKENVAVFISARSSTTACTNIWVESTGTKITCGIGAATPAGFDLPLIVQVGGQVTQARLISFVGPAITTGSLRRDSCINPGVSNVEMTDVTGGVVICFDGTNLAGLTSVQYGTQFADGTAKWFTCISPSFYSTNTVTCRTTEATGRGLVWRARVGVVWSRPSIDTISYPVPAYVPGTIRSLVAAPVVGATVLKPAGARTQGDWIVMDVKYVPEVYLSGYLTVTFSQPGGVVASCASVTVYGPNLPPPNNYTANYAGADAVTTKAIRCRTPPGTGAGYVFTVTALNTPSLPSTDSYTYPDAGPRVTRISGCSPDPSNPLATIDCPTSAGGAIYLTLTGVNYCDNTDVGSGSDNGTASCNPVARVGSRQCESLDYPTNDVYNSTTMVCKVPNGNGVRLPFFLIMDGTFAVIDTGVYVSYASPTITGVSGCTATSATHTTNCASVNTNNTQITISGINFGASGAIVMVGPSQCTNVVHDPTTPHTLLRCTLPNGRGLRLPISVLQLNGAITQSSTVMVSYQDCAAGSMRSLNPLTSLNCTLCAPGTYSNIAGSIQCTSCATGRVTTGYGATECTTCGIGTFASTGGSLCINCTLGRTAASAGLSICTDCSAGTYSIDRASCISCQPSNYTATAGQSACSTCTAGYYSDRSGAYKCDPCPIGSYSLSAANKCTSCVAGTYASSAASTTCTVCASGYVSRVTQSQTCVACDSGSIAATTGLSVCTTCDAGKFAVSGQSSCSSCPLGRYGPQPSAATCLPCAKGTAANVTGVTSCTPCSKGYRANDIGQGSCSQCPAGRFTDSTGTAECSLCSPGKYAPTSGLLSCIECPAGTRGNTAGATQCDSCLAGSYQSLTGQANCITATAGQYVATSGQQSPSSCDRGYYSSAGSSQCTECPLGTYQSESGQSSCIDCASGFAASSTHATICTSCDIGRSAILTGQAQCSECSPGTYSSTSGAVSCTKCEAGSVTASVASTNCTLCLAGWYQAASGGSECIQCPSGSFTSSTGQASCSTCPAGSYSVTGATRCESCDPGRAQITSGQSACVECEAGKHSDVSGLASCKICDSGDYSTGTGNIECSKCDVGTYSQINNGNGATQCTSCPTGRANANKGSSACSDCSVGRYADQSGLATCLPCGVGTFAATTGRGNCQQCGQGKSAAFVGAINCEDCASGSFSAAVGSSNCTLCAAGTYALDRGVSVCLPCGPGRATPSEGFETECPPCATGTFAANSGQAQCVDCASGKIADSIRSESCTDCSAGTYSDPIGRSSCLDCSEGKYSNGTGNGACTSCPPGYFQGVKGKAFCTPCDIGTYSVGDADKCESCSGNTVAATAGSSSCAACSSGVPDSKNAICICPVGQYFTVEVVSGVSRGVCRNCPSGAYCVEDALDLADIGPAAGYWRETNTSLVFYRCLLVAHCPGGGHDGCGSYREGPLCAVCVSNTRTTSTGECAPCQDTKSGNNVQIAFIIIAIIIAVIVMYYLVLRSDRALVTRVEAEDVHRIKYERSLKNFIDGIKETIDDDDTNGGKKDKKKKKPRKSTIALNASSSSSNVMELATLDGIAVSPGGPMSPMSPVPGSPTPLVGNTNGTAFDDTSSNHDDIKDNKDADGKDKDPNVDSGEDSDSDDEVDEDPHSGESDSLDFRPIGKPNLTYKLKIILGFFQIGTNITFALDIPWPNLFKSFVQLFNVFNLDFIQWSSVSCVTLIDFYVKMVIIAIVPAVVILLLVLCFYLPYTILHPGQSPEQIAARKLHRRKTWKLALFTAFLVYPKVSSSMLSMYVCREVGSHSYLLSDFSLECYDSTWTKWVPFNVVMLLVYPVGIPVLFFWLLARYRTRFHSNSVRIQLGFLYDGYSKNTWWFELVDMMHKLILTSILPFFPAGVQMPLGMAVVFGYAILILITQPYFRKSDDRLHLCAQCEIFLLMLAGFIFYNDEELDIASDAVLSIFLIIVIAVFVGLFFTQTANLVVKKLLARIPCCTPFVAWFEARKAKRRAAKAALINEELAEQEQLLNPAAGAAAAGTTAVATTENSHIAPAGGKGHVRQLSRQGSLPHGALTGSGLPVVGTVVGSNTSHSRGHSGTHSRGHSRSHSRRSSSFTGGIAPDLIAAMAADAAGTSNHGKDGSGSGGSTTTPTSTGNPAVSSPAATAVGPGGRQLKKRAPGGAPYGGGNDESVTMQRNPMFSAEAKSRASEHDITDVNVNTRRHDTRMKQLLEDDNENGGNTGGIATNTTTPSSNTNDDLVVLPASRMPAPSVALAVSPFTQLANRRNISSDLLGAESPSMSTTSITPSSSIHDGLTTGATATAASTAVASTPNSSSSTSSTNEGSSASLLAPIAEVPSSRSRASSVNPPVAAALPASSPPVVDTPASGVPHDNESSSPSS